MEPPLDVAMLVNTEVVQDQVDVELLRDRSIEGVEEQAELSIAMAEMELRHHGSVQRIEGRKQVNVPVASVVVRASLGEAGSEGQNGLSAVERLDLGLLVHREHDSALRRVQVEADHVVDLLDVVLVPTDLE